ncbi:carbon-nitrogen hydrolase family protein [Naasia lichenicola]|uniref:Carbon-nitrogen hydrolase family protein n=1 Tax=Naasia lichenicola TaxID=2565933 RepID=A0A4S4FSQ7_9MICO|nr:carbon-nitrogen hydrolase family protein [Naasia lichenicola]THG32942.1 carbon-nitrogen hydrolase family protein [Naasia lichenicola]
MSRPLPIALVQEASVAGGDLALFATDVERLTRIHPSTRLFVYPELHLTPGEEFADGSGDEFALAEPLDGPRDAALSQLASDLGIWLAPGSFLERGANGEFHNTSAVYSPRGERVASYRKMFPWRPYETVTPGTEFVVFDMEDFGRVGLSICYDSWFPESTRHLAWMGAELILNVVKTPTADRAQELVIAQANAIVNQVFFASVNAAAPDGRGQSLLIDPQGGIRSQAVDSSAQVLSTVIDLDDVQHARDFGTAGVSRPWQQFVPGDVNVPLPLYSGRLDADVWKSRL